MPRDADEVVLQLYARTPAPCRDYCGLTITQENVVLNIWNITFGPHVYPRRHRCTVENFEQDKYMQVEVIRVFGQHVFDYVMSMSRNECNLQNLPTKVFLNVIKYLAARDVVHLSQTSKILFERCEMDNTWHVLFRKIMRRRPDRQDMVIAGNCGWKETLKQKLHLQGRKGGKSAPIAPKATTNKIGFQKRLNLVESKTSVIKKSLENELVVGNVRTKLDVVKKSSEKEVKIGNARTKLYAVQKSSEKEVNTGNARTKLDTVKKSPEKEASTGNARTKLYAVQKSSEKDVNTGNVRTKLDTVKRSPEKESFVGKLRTKLDAVKSTSALTTPKVPTPNNMKSVPAKSVINLNEVRTVSTRNLGQTKNDLNSVRKPAKDTNITIQIPTILEKFSSYNKSAPRNSKSTGATNLVSKYTVSAKSKSGGSKI